MAQDDKGMTDTSDDLPEEKTPRAWNGFWQDEVTSAEKRLRLYRRQGNNAVSVYLDDDTRQTGWGDEMLPTTGKRAKARLNLFHTNVSTMYSMLSGSTPKVDVTREFADPNDDVARVASNILQRVLECDIEPSGADLTATLKACLLDRLLPGMGIARVRYEYESENISSLEIDPQTGTAQPVESEQITYENAAIDYVHWQDFLWGWARRWEEVPWIAFRAWLTKDEAKERFSEKIANDLTYEEQTPSGSSDDQPATDQKNNVRKAAVWEIWSKKEGKVFWFSEGASLILDMEDDPLEIDGFWPMPRPMIANPSTSMMVPKSDYSFSSDIYQEIDVLYTRITALTRAIKVVGVYDQSAGASVGRMLKEAAENELIPVENWAMFAEKGGLKGTIDWFPVQDVVATLATLREILGQQIELLYQVTGMSDVLRGGNTDQYTSDGTNQLKAKFGSIRIQDMQDEFARFASELESIKAQVVSKHFQPQSILQQSNAQFLAPVDLQLVPPALELIKSPDILWRVNIKPESLSMMDMAKIKNDRIEFMTASGSFLQSAVSMGSEFPESAPLLLEMLKFGISGFAASDEIEGVLDGIIDNLIKKAQEKEQNPEADPAQQEQQTKMMIEKSKLELQQMKGQQEIQKIQMKAQTDMQLLKMKVDGELAKINTDSQADQSLEALNARNDLIKIREDLNASIQEISVNLNADLQVEAAQSEMAIAEKDVEHAYTTTELLLKARLDAEAREEQEEESRES